MVILTVRNDWFNIFAIYLLSIPYENRKTIFPFGGFILITNEELKEAKNLSISDESESLTKIFFYFF